MCQNELFLAFSPLTERRLRRVALGDGKYYFYLCSLRFLLFIAEAFRLSRHRIG